MSLSEQLVLENPELVQAFVDVTDELYLAFPVDQLQVDLIERESGIDKETVVDQYQTTKFLF